MEVTINTRHVSVPESIRNQSHIRLQRIARFNPNVLGATAIFTADGMHRQMDIRLAIRGGSPILGHGQGPTFRTALDRAVERVQTQLKRRNQRHRSRRARADQQFLQASTA